MTAVPFTPAELLQAEATKELERRLIKTNLHAFVKEFWKYVDPAPFNDTWVVGAICEHLQAVADSQIMRLLINIHFRSAKTTLAGILFPAWIWQRTPEEQILYLSHTARRAYSASEHSRDLIVGPYYQKAFGDKFQLTKNTATLLETDKGGSRTTLSVESAVTGEGGNLNIFDDPNDVEEVESPVKREAMNARFDNLGTRANDFAKVRWVVAQQRTHPKDVSGHIEELGLQFEKLIIPLEYQGKKYVTSLGWSDPRTEVGKISDETRFRPQDITELKLRLGYRYQGQANQNPTTAEGVVIKRGWFLEQEKFVFDGVPEERLCIYFDLGGSASKEADYTVGTVLYRQEGDSRDRNSRYVILWQLSGQWGAFDRDDAIEGFCKVWDKMFPAIPIWIESTFGLAKDIAPDISNRLIDCGLNSNLDWARKRKFARCEPVIAAAKAGRIYTLTGNAFTSKGFSNTDWLPVMLNEFERLKVRETAQGPEFYDAHDDRLDSLAGAFDTLTHMVL